MNEKKEIMKNVTVRMPESQIFNLKADAKSLDYSLSKVIRMAIEYPDKLDRLLALSKQLDEDLK